MQITVRLFGPYAQEAGKEIRLEVESPATPQQVFDSLQDRSPRLERLRRHCRVAVNWEFMEWNTPLKEGDEVAFIPPVSGGISKRGMLNEEDGIKKPRGGRIGMVVKG